jgi:hypothetical protein
VLSNFGFSAGLMTLPTALRGMSSSKIAYSGSL